MVWVGVSEKRKQNNDEYCHVVVLNCFTEKFAVHTWSNVFSNCFLNASLAAACFWAGVSVSILGVLDTSVSLVAPRVPLLMRLTRLAGSPVGRFFGSWNEKWGKNVRYLQRIIQKSDLRKKPNMLHLQR